MHLLDLPLEIFRHIIKLYFNSIPFVLAYDLKNVQLVNSQCLHRLGPRKTVILIRP